MAFLGGIPGLGALAGGVEQGIGQGFNIDQYLQGIQSQNLAGNILSQAYGGGQPSTGGGLLSGLSSLFGGGQGGGASSTGQGSPLSGLAAGSGVQPVSSQSMVPGLTSGQPGTASPGNLFGGGTGAGPTSQMAAQQPSAWQPPQAQAQPSASPQGTSLMPQQGFTPPQPFQPNQGFVGGQNQLTLPQFVQMARKVNPNASGRQIMLAAGELAKGGLLGYGAMSPYQAAELAIRSGAERRDWEDLDRKIREGNERARHDQSMEGEAGARLDETRAKEAAGELDRGVTEAEASLKEATTALNENRHSQDAAARDIVTLNGQMEDQRGTPEWADQMKEAKDRLTELKSQEKELRSDVDAAKKTHADAVTKREGAIKAAQSYGGGGKGSGTEDDPVKVSSPAEANGLPPGTIYQTPPDPDHPDGQIMVR